MTSPVQYAFGTMRASNGAASGLYLILVCSMLQDNYRSLCVD
jgi:hypothetical protein